MHAATVLSPHRDDAVFSLALCLSKWCSACRLIVLNFFTESAYAPQATAIGERSVSQIRCAEDRRALAAIDRRIRLDSAGLLDAPVRLGIDAGEVCSPDTLRLQDFKNLEALRSIIRDRVRPGLVIAPLGLGDHIDHLSVRNIAAQILRGHNLAFYEDLPYAIWTSDTSLKDHVTECEERTHVALKPVLIRDANAITRKRAIAGLYQSQITPAEAAGIARFAARYGGAERIWIPRFGKRWKSLLRSYA